METPEDYGEDEMNEINDMNDTNDNIDTVKFIEYLKLPIKEIKMEIVKKNKELLKLNEQKEESKTKLNVVIKDLNELVSKNSEILCQKVPDLYIISQLERRFGIKNNHLQTSKKINKTFKTQYKSISSRVNNFFDPEKINSFENEIDLLKKNNLEMNIKIKELKDHNLENTKKIEILRDNQKYKENLKSHTEEIKSLESKKHDYFVKISSNKKSLDNILQEKQNLLLLYNENIKKARDGHLVSTINFWLELIKSDLEGTQEDIFKKIENNQSRVVREVDKNSNHSSIINPLYLPIISAYNGKSSSIDKKSNLKKNHNKKHKNITISINNVSSTKIYYNNKSYSSSRKNYNITDGSEKLKKKQKFLINNNSKNVINRTDHNSINNISFEYEITTDNEYRDLLNKKDEYVKMINKLEESIKEAKKVTVKKAQHIYNIVSDNSNKLEVIKNDNSLIEKEIEKLEKVYQLTKKKIEIENKIQENELKKKKQLEIEREKQEKEKLKKQHNNSDIYLNSLKSKNASKKNLEITIPNDDSENKEINEIPEKEKIELDKLPEQKSQAMIDRETRLQEIRIKYLQLDKQKKKQNEQKIDEDNNEDENDNLSNDENDNINSDENDNLNNDKNDNLSKDKNDNLSNDKNDNINNDENDNINNDEINNVNDEKNYEIGNENKEENIVDNQNNEEKEIINNDENKEQDELNINNLKEEKKEEEKNDDNDIINKKEKEVNETQDKKEENQNDDIIN